MKIDLYYSILSRVMLGGLNIKDLLKLAKKSNLLSFILGDGKLVAKMPHRRKIEKIIVELPFAQRHPFISFLHTINQDPHFESWLDNLIVLSQKNLLTVDFLNALYDLTATTSVEYASQIMVQLKDYDRQQFVSLLEKKKKHFQTRVECHFAKEEPFEVNSKLPIKFRRSNTNEGFSHAHKSTCSPEEIKKINEFIESIGYEITPWQPTESQLEQQRSVPKGIEQFLLDLIPHSGLTLLNCLKKFAEPSGNLSQMYCWLQSFLKLYRYQINHGLIDKNEKSSFFKTLIDLTNETSLEFSQTVMDLFLHKDLKLLDKKDLMASLKEMGAEYPKQNKDDYYPIHANEKDILKMLKKTESPYLPLLKKTKETIKELKTPKIEHSVSKRMVASQ